MHFFLTGVERFVVLHHRVDANDGLLVKSKVLPKGMWSKSIHYFYSLKNQSYCWCESMLERDALLVMEFDDDIERYKTQPISIQYKNAFGKVCRYTPDSLFKRKSSGEFVFREVKMSNRVNEELKAKFALINRQIMKSYDSRLEIITDSEIRVGNRIDNLKVLYSYRRVDINQSDAMEIMKALPQEHCYSELIDCAKRLGAPDVTPLALLAHGYLYFDTTSPLVGSTRIIQQ